MAIRALRGSWLRPSLRDFPAWGAGQWLASWLNLIPHLYRSGRSKLLRCLVVGLAGCWLLVGGLSAHALDGTNTGAPFGLCLPSNDSFDWGDCYNSNFTVLNTSFTTSSTLLDALGVSTAAIAVTVTASSNARIAADFAIGASTTAIYNTVVSSVATLSASTVALVAADAAETAARIAADYAIGASTLTLFNQKFSTAGGTISGDTIALSSFTGGTFIGYGGLLSGIPVVSGGDGAVQFSKSGNLGGRTDKIHFNEVTGTFGFGTAAGTTRGIRISTNIIGEIEVCSQTGTPTCGGLFTASSGANPYTTFTADGSLRFNTAGSNRGGFSSSGAMYFGTDPVAAAGSPGDVYISGNATATTFIGAVTVNATTASALASNGSNCSAGSFPLGVDVNGAVESCTTVSSSIPNTLISSMTINSSFQVGASTFGVAGGIVSVGGTGAPVGASVIRLNSVNNYMVVQGTANAAGSISLGQLAYGSATPGAPGTAVLTWTDGGNVGIGTASPAEKVHILAGDKGGLKIQSSVQQPKLLMCGPDAIGSVNERCWGTTLSHVSYGDWHLRVSSAATSDPLGATGTTVISANSAGAVTIGPGGTPLAVISTRTFTPTITHGTNVAATTPGATQCDRTGNIASCAGVVDVDPTAAGMFEINISLPVASDFTTGYDAGGNGVGVSGTLDMFGCFADSTNNNIYCKGIAAGTGNISYGFQFKYQIK